MQTNNWNEWKRMLKNIDKALYNERVTKLLTLHYCYLHSMLVKKGTDEDIFNDAYLKLTYLYNPEKDFIYLFGYYFKLLKGAYYRDNKVTRWLEIPLPPKDIPNTIESVEIERTNKEEFFKTLKYAITKESTKDKKQNL